MTSKHARAITLRTATADWAVRSICPYCAVGCGQKVYVEVAGVRQLAGRAQRRVESLEGQAIRYQTA